MDLVSDADVRPDSPDDVPQVPGLQLPQPPVHAAPCAVSAEAAAAHVNSVKDHTLHIISLYQPDHSLTDLITT